MTHTHITCHLLQLFLFLFFLTRAVFRPAVNRRFPKQSHYDGFVMRNCRGLCAFDSQHVRRNCIAYVAEAFFRYAVLRDISGHSTAACLQSITIYTRKCGTTARRVGYQRDRAIFVIKAAKAIVHYTRGNTVKLYVPLITGRPISIARRHEIRF